MARSPTVLAGVASSLVRSADAFGVSASAIEERVGFGQDSLSAVDGRISLRAYEKLWAYIDSCVGDPEFGLRAGAERSASTFGVLGYLAMSSQTLGEALRRGSRLFKLVNESGALGLEYSFNAVCITRAYDRSPLALREDAFLATMLSLGQRWSKQRILPLEIRLAERRGTDHSALQRFFRCKVSAGCGRTQIVFAKELLDRRLVRADPQLTHYLEEIAEHQFRTLRYENELVKRLLAFLETAGEQSDRSLEAAAQHLGISRRTLQRRLEENGIVYRDIIDAARRKQALAVLESNISVRDAARALGYADVSSFRRAVRRWTGMSPSAYQRGHKD